MLTKVDIIPMRNLLFKILQLLWHSLIRTHAQVTSIGTQEELVKYWGLIGVQSLC